MTRTVALIDRAPPSRRNSWPPHELLRRASTNPSSGDPLVEGICLYQGLMDVPATDEEASALCAVEAVFDGTVRWAVSIWGLRPFSPSGRIASPCAGSCVVDRLSGTRAFFLL